MNSAARHLLDRPGTVLPLAKVDGGMLAWVGGKAANLGVLINAGLPVPDGFCITTTAYQRVAAEAGLDAILAELEAGVGAGASAGTGASASTGASAGGSRDTSAEGAAALAGLAERARSAMEAAPMPDDIADAVRAAYAELGNNDGDGRLAVAVRSSATAEDLPEASFAGQQDTYLNVVGEDALLDALRRCWASLWTERAVAYRSDNGIDQRSVSIAVVVQRMVDAEVSGVLFTANPLTGRRHEAVIDAAPGLGEAVVSGAVNPDQIVVDTASGRILERTLGDTLGRTADDEPGRTPGDNPAGSGEACLDDEQVRALAELGARAEEHFGEPQDLEWAIGPDGAIQLVQSRPITTLYPLPEPVETGSANDGGTRAYLCASLLQGLTRPLTPMGLSAFEVLADAYRPAGGNYGAPVPFSYSQAGLRLFVDVTPVLRSKTGRRIIPAAMRAADARSVGALKYLMEDPRFSILSTPKRGALKGSLRGSLKGSLKSMPQLAMIPQVLHGLVRPAAALERSRRAEQEFHRMLVLPEPATPARRLDFVESMLGRMITPGLLKQLPPPAAGYIWLGIVRWLLGPLVQPGDLQAVLRGLPDNVTTQMDLELWHAATIIRDDADAAQALTHEDPPELARRYAEGSLPAVAQRELTAFLDKYGHRAVAEIDLGIPRWSEEPAHIINVLANYLRLNDPDQAPDRQFARAAATAEAKAAELTQRARTRGRIRGRLVAYGLRRVRATAGRREYPKFGLIVALAALRAQLRQVGTVLAGAGRIANPEDIFFLDLAETRVGLRGADLHELAAERRRTYNRELRRRRIPRLLLSDGTDVEAAMGASASATTTAGAHLPPGTLTGAPASAGTVTGQARVILDPAGAHLEPGEILVAPSTDPGWTPLFLTAGALVMEMGGPISHGAVVAREYGIPAVVGVPDATTRIATGDTITVDGAAGTISQVASAIAQPPSL
ncbi:PEP/pyruvate-binding domain-containing protein [Arthrobacter sp. VKM Ac-2550]|uniref:PEP/pyruvate-binding domain-containing protein n=1 Tax=Crystallibacter permensis TaxID=1938888 RepID=UPI002225F4A7|nr:PEP/pyruvate-binding domain-containing protein [Arthrobacter sp. VKM Ac-2550]MCW2134414.1 pyruvate, water dikinase [Arthrobacter sp. VKM Ac-2550]